MVEEELNNDDLFGKSKLSEDEDFEPKAKYTMPPNRSRSLSNEFLQNGL